MAQEIKGAIKGDGGTAVPLNRHSGMFVAGTQCPKTLDACLRRHDGHYLDHYGLTRLSKYSILNFKSINNY